MRSVCCTRVCRWAVAIETIRYGSNLRTTALIRTCSRYSQKYSYKNNTHLFWDLRSRLWLNSVSRRMRLLGQTPKMWRKDGLNSCRYKTLSVERTALYVNVTVDIGTPPNSHWERPAPDNNNTNTHRERRHITASPGSSAWSLPRASEPLRTLGFNVRNLSDTIIRGFFLCYLDRTYWSEPFMKKLLDHNRSLLETVTTYNNDHSVINMDETRRCSLSENVKCWGAFQFRDLYSTELHEGWWTCTVMVSE